MKTFFRAAPAAAAVLASALIAGVLMGGEAQAFSPKMPHGMARKIEGMRAGAMARGRMAGSAATGLLKRGMGLGAAALAGGLALDAAFPAPEPECSIAERPAVDDLGNTYYERIRVCD